MKFATHTILIVLCGLLTQSAEADTVFFNNGRFLDGVIKKETASYIMLDMGVGSTKIMKSNISRIERSSDQEKSDIQKEWMRENPAHKKYAPEKYKELAEEFRQLRTARFDALKAGRYVGDYTRINDDLKEEVAKMKESLQRAEDSLKITPPDQEDIYKKIQDKINSLQDAIKTAQHKLDNSEAERAGAISRVNGYQDMLAEFENSFAQSTDGYKATDNQEERTFVELIAEELEMFKKDFNGKISDPSAQPQGAPGPMIGPGGVPGGMPGGSPFAPTGDAGPGGSPFAPIK